MGVKQHSKQQDVAFYMLFFKAWGPYGFNKKCMLNCQMVGVLWEEEAPGAKDLIALLKVQI